MNQAKFAELCDVSGAMISKHAAQGRVIFRGRKVDAAESLKALEGHLDEDKRLAAVKALAEIEAKTPPALFDVVEGGRADAAPGPDAAPGEPASWRARRDKFAALSAEVDYYERVGALVDASEIAAAVEMAIAGFWTETERSLKLDAAEMAAELKLDADQACALKALMIRQHRRLRENCAKAFRRAAADAGGAGGAKDHTA